MEHSDSDAVKRAKNILRGQSAEPGDILTLAKTLKTECEFGWARRLLVESRKARITDSALRVELGQLHALCTYKDPDLPAREKLDDAVQILKTVDNLATTGNQEILGLAGAVYKRMWELGAQKRDLERAALYYRRGFDAGPATDYGYTAINAAYVLDRLADFEEKEAEETGSVSEIAHERRREAERIRRVLTTDLPPLLEIEANEWLRTEWWFLVTLAEAHFGLGEYDPARKWLNDAKSLSGVAHWEFETTARQLASIALLRGPGTADDPEGSPAWNVLKEFLGDNLAAVRTVFAGKLGLGLSGGGFRASLFHIGVLAKLAEVDLLRHVHVLSCVSGGSIIGAHYYLELRHLLRRKADADIGRDDYEQLVLRMMGDFLKGVQRNVRMRVAANPWANLKMLFFPAYSRTQRIGELFETEIYSRIKDGEGDGPRWLNALYIHPKGEPDSFKPKRDNWRRGSKVPMLVLNSTALNTGHAWQFTASWMGESPIAIDPDIDGNARLRRMYYPDAPEPFRQVRLGHAVGASACVPGLFEPIALENLYPDMTVRLVDGGVHDNQGIASLLEQDCSVLMISDASGQMTTEKIAQGGVLGPLLRSNSVLMSRVRQAQFQDLKARLRSSIVKGLTIVHLKKDLDVDTVAWVDCEEPAPVPARARKPLTGYGILKNVQERLAAIRTDLDSFTDVEAYALMTSGYRQAETYLSGITGFPKPPPSTIQWPFLEIEDPMKTRQGVEDRHDRMMKLLDVGSAVPFKIWRLSGALKGIALALALLVLAGFAWAWWTHPSFVVFQLSVGDVGWVILAGVVGLVFGAVAKKLFEYRQTIARVGIALGMGLFGWIAAQIHLRVFDPWFLRLGRLSALPKGQRQAAAVPPSRHKTSAWQTSDVSPR